MKHNNISIHYAKYFSVYRNNTDNNISNNKSKEYIVNQNDIGLMTNYKTTNMELIDKNCGLREFIKKTYLWTGGGICGSIGLSIIGSQIIQIYPHSVFGVLSLGTMIGLDGAIGIGFTKYSTHKDIISNKKK